MRELKFRGKQITWIYGGISIFDGEATIYDYDCVVNSAYEVDIKTVGQFTGLLDKNGTEIYEGDILQWTSSWKKHDNAKDEGMVYNNVVEYYAGANHCGYRLRNKSFTKPLTGKNGIYNAKAIVIGNIHENPELL